MHSDIHPAWCGCAACRGPRRPDGPDFSRSRDHRLRLAAAALAGAIATALALSPLI